MDHKDGKKYQRRKEDECAESVQESHNPCDVVSDLDAAQQVTVTQKNEISWNKSHHEVG